MPSSLKSVSDLPLIDISQFPSNFDDLEKHPWLAAVRQGCEEFGFFYVVDRGIPNQLFEDLESVIHELCAMPAKAKEKAATCNPINSYLLTPFSEAFFISKLPDSNSLEELNDKIWPEEGNPRFCDTIRTYTLCMEELSRKIGKIIIASLGLHVETFYHSDFENCRASMRINHYMCEGKSIEEQILFPHTDLNCFTILYQDNKGGLQIRSKEGDWLNVKPVSRCFVVNVGDSLKAWSNGRYRSAEHRAVCKGKVDRYSVPYFVTFSDDKEISAPSDLVNDEHPQRYRPFILKDVVAEFLNSTEFKEKKNAPEFFDRYVGI